MREKRGGWWPVVVTAAMMSVAIYVGSYFALTNKSSSWNYFRPVGADDYFTRKCPAQWMVNLYQPLAMVEEAMTGDHVSLR